MLARLAAAPRRARGPTPALNALRHQLRAFSVAAINGKPELLDKFKAAQEAKKTLAINYFT